MDYELLYIIDADLQEDARKDLITRFNTLIESNEGKVENVEEWGKRRLAYLVNDKPDGYYVLVHFSSPPTFPKELERVMEIDEGVMRYLVTRVEHKSSKVKPQAPKAAAPELSAPVPEPGIAPEAPATEE